MHISFPCLHKVLVPSVQPTLRLRKPVCEALHCWSSRDEPFKAALETRFERPRQAPAKSATLCTASPKAANDQLNAAIWVSHEQEAVSLGVARSTSSTLLRERFMASNTVNRKLIETEQTMAAASRSLRDTFPLRVALGISSLNWGRTSSSQPSNN